MPNKYIQEFDTEQDYSDSMTGGGYSVKNVSLVKSPKTVHYDPYIHFQDANLEAKCIELYSSDGVGLSYADAEAVTELVKTDFSSTYTSFDELKYFKNLVTIPSGMFYYWNNLKSITIPENVETCPVGAFDRCNKLERITWNTSKCLTMQSGYRNNYNTQLKYQSDNPYFSVVNGCLYNYNKTILYAVPSTATSYEWLGTEREIYARAFYYSRIAGNMVFPKSLDTIGDVPFYNATLLTGADLSKTNIRKTEYMIFRCSDTFSTIILPKNIKELYQPTIGVYSIKNIVFPETLTKLTGRPSLMGETLIFLSKTPPALINTSSSLPQVTAIYVPDDVVDTYKAASIFSTAADKIYPLSEYTEVSDE